MKYYDGVNYVNNMEERYRKEVETLRGILE